MRKLEIVDNKYYIDGKEFVEKEPEAIDEIKIPEQEDRGRYCVDFSYHDGFVDNPNYTISCANIVNRSIFRNKTEAKRQARKWVLTRKLEDLAERENEGWKPDWRDEQEYKYYFSYDYSFEKEGWELVATVDEYIPNTVYFKSKEVMEKCLESKEVLAVLNELRELQ